MNVAERKKKGAAKQKASYHSPSAILAVGASFPKKWQSLERHAAATTLPHSEGMIIFHHIQYV